LNFLSLITLAPAATASSGGVKESINMSAMVGVVALAGAMVAVALGT
jgi:hypothetical protein